MRKYKKDHPDKPIRNLFYSLISILSAFAFAGGFVLLELERLTQAYVAFAFCTGAFIAVIVAFLKSKNR